MGKDEKTILEIARRTNMPIPTRIQEAPELELGLMYYYEAFCRLTTSRSLGYGSVGAIPYSAISQYCKDEGLVEDDRADMFYHIEHLDAAYIIWQTEKSKQGQAK